MSQTTKVSQGALRAETFVVSTDDYPTKDYPTKNYPTKDYPTKNYPTMKTLHFFHKPIVLKGLTAVLWIVSSALALFALNGAIDVTATIFAAFWAEGGLYGEAYGGAVALRQIVVLFGSLLVVASIIGSLEYHIRHFNTPGSWRLFGRILGVEAGILLLAVMF
jgi:hypothetical protein